MIGLDTNVLVRWLTQDDPVQSRRATELIENGLTEDQPGFVSVVTMAETVWVLERVYGAGGPEIATAIEHLLTSDRLVIDREQDVFTAAAIVKEGLGSFSDALIAAVGASAGCRRTLTFDKKAVNSFRLGPLKPLSA